MTKLTVKVFKKAVKDTGGILKDIAHNAGVERVAVWSFLKKHPNLQELIEDEREKIVDTAEGSLYSQVKGRQEWATKFILKTKGRKRGYIEKSEVEHSGEATVHHSFANVYNEVNNEPGPSPTKESDKGKGHKADS